MQERLERRFGTKLSSPQGPELPIIPLGMTQMTLIGKVISAADKNNVTMLASN